MRWERFWDWVSTCSRFPFVLQSALQECVSLLWYYYEETLIFCTFMYNSSKDFQHFRGTSKGFLCALSWPWTSSRASHCQATNEWIWWCGEFEIAGDLQATSRFIDSLKILYIAPSLGGCESLVEQPTIFFILGERGRQNLFSIFFCNLMF